MSDTPNRLVALVFDDPYKADEARAALRRMAGEGLLELGETALIERRADGNIRVSQETDTVANDKHLGHIAGLVAAAVTGITPLIIAGTIGGELIGKLRDDGITDKFLKALQKEVETARLVGDLGLILKDIGGPTVIGIMAMDEIISVFEEGDLRRRCVGVA